MAHDPEVVRSAIEHLRKELRGRTGSKLSAGDGPPHGMMEGSPEEEASESPREAHAEGDTTCPKCGHKFKGAPGKPEFDGPPGAEGHGGKIHESDPGILGEGHLPHLDGYPGHIEGAPHRSLARTSAVDPDVHQDGYPGTPGQLGGATRSKLDKEEVEQDVKPRKGYSRG